METIENEVWKAIPNYENLYEASTCGRIKRLAGIVIGKDGRKCHIKENITYGYGNKYKMIGLSKNGIEEMKPVHYWIMITFSPNPNPDIYDEINHKDENPSNNKLDNLEWCSKSYNKRYGTRIRRVLDTFKKVNSPKQEKPVLQYTKDNVFIAEYVSISEAARKTNSSFKHISDCCLGKRKTHNGYVWKIKEVA